MNSKLPSSKERFSSDMPEVVEPLRLAGTLRVRGDGGIIGLLDVLALWFSRSRGEL